MTRWVRDEDRAWRLALFALTAAVGLWLIWPALTGVWHGVPWYGTVYVWDKDGRQIYWHVWFIVLLASVVFWAGIAVLVGDRRRRRRRRKRR